MGAAQKSAMFFTWVCTKRGLTGAAGQVEPFADDVIRYQRKETKGRNEEKGRNFQLQPHQGLLNIC